MALKGKKHSRGTKTAISVVILLGSLAIGEIVNMFWSLAARSFGFEYSTIETVGSCTIFGLAALIAGFIIWMVWPDATPQQQQAKRLAQRAAAAAVKSTPRFDEMLAKDAAARAALMAEEVTPVDSDTISRDWEAVNADFHSPLAQDLRRRR